MVKLWDAEDMKNYSSKINEEIHFNNNENEENQIIGRRGELFANIILPQFYEDFHFNRIIWLNKEKESGLPYDFIIELENNEKIFVEVKSTSFYRRFDEISINEIQSAIDLKQNFHVLRVVGVREKPRFYLYRNLLSFFGENVKLLLLYNTDLK